MTQGQDFSSPGGDLADGYDRAADQAAEFSGELARLRESLVYTGRAVNTLAAGFGSGLRRAFDGVVFDGVRLQDALRGVALSMSKTAYDVAMKPIQNAAGGALAQGLSSLLGGIVPFASGGAFASGRVTAFAKGGVVSAPTPFAMRGGQAGLMGEAGPEAIMPLARGADGRLGVAAQGGARPVTVVMNIQTPDAASFQRSQSQIAASAQRLLARGQKNR